MWNSLRNLKLYCRKSNHTLCKSACILCISLRRTFFWSWSLCFTSLLGYLSRFAPLVLIQCCPFLVYLSDFCFYTAFLERFLWLFLLCQCVVFHFLREVWQFYLSVWNYRMPLNIRRQRKLVEIQTILRR